MESVLLESPLPRSREHRLSIDPSASVPYAYSGLRRLLMALAETAPDAVGERARARPAEWAFLFPDGDCASTEARSLSELVLAPSERRLDADSEQIFRVLDAAADATAGVVATTRRPLVVRAIERCDPLTLRGLLRVAERLGAANAYDTLRSALSRRSPLGLAASLGQAGDAEKAALASADRLLAAAVDGTRSPGVRLGAALAVLDAAYLAGDTAGRVAAAYAGLSALRRNPRLEEAVEFIGSHGNGVYHPAVDSDASDLTSYANAGALLWRAVGVARAHAGDARGALRAFDRALAAAPSSVVRARVLMYRAITLLKLLGALEGAAADAESGLSLVAARDDDPARLEEAWLRNVLGLVHYRTGELAEAREQQEAALAAIAPAPNGAAASLGLTLRSNLVTLHLAAGRLDAAFDAWRRLGEMFGGWEVSFLKHHLYRGGWLCLFAGDLDGAIDDYSLAHCAAAAAVDHFHQQAIAVEVGTLTLDAGRLPTAREWFDRGIASAHEIGDPVCAAESLAGAGLASGCVDARGIARLASRSLARSKEAERLQAAVAGGDRDELRRLLPRPRPFLQRPFWPRELARRRPRAHLGTPRPATDPGRGSRSRTRGAGSGTRPDR